MLVCFIAVPYLNLRVVWGRTREKDVDDPTLLVFLFFIASWFPTGLDGVKSLTKLYGLVLSALLGNWLKLSPVP